MIEGNRLSEKNYLRIGSSHSLELSGKRAFLIYLILSYLLQRLVNIGQMLNRVSELSDYFVLEFNIGSNDRMIIIN